MEWELALDENALCFVFMVRIVLWEKPVAIDGFEVGKDAEDILQAVIFFLAPPDFFVGLDAKVVCNAQRPDDWVAFLDRRQVSFPIPIELVGQDGPWSVDMRIPAVPDRSPRIPNHGENCKSFNRRKAKNRVCCGVPYKESELCCGDEFCCA